ncbi:hypothetical protein ACFY05_41815 [Microtetraspora fusca]|uniref:Uncharacterized protein n=1 Tax=Microtetraspora fusca TaxID=1997 RepID=A0ABW6VJ30_MICFU
MIAILDSSGNLHIAGQVKTGQTNMTCETGM